MEPSLDFLMSCFSYAAEVGGHLCSPQQPWNEEQHGPSAVHPWADGIYTPSDDCCEITHCPLCHTTITLKKEEPVHAED